MVAQVIELSAAVFKVPSSHPALSLYSSLLKRFCLKIEHCLKAMNKIQIASFVAQQHNCYGTIFDCTQSLGKLRPDLAGLISDEKRTRCD